MVSDERLQLLDKFSIALVAAGRISLLLFLTQV